MLLCQSHVGCDTQRGPFCAASDPDCSPEQDLELIRHLLCFQRADLLLLNVLVFFFLTLQHDLHCFAELEVILVW